MAIMVGTGRGAHAGVLIRNAEALETLEKVDTLVVDKTGTLTAGKPTVETVVASAGFDEAEVVRMAASLEQGSEHPLAAAWWPRRPPTISRWPALPISNRKPARGDGKSGREVGGRSAMRSS